MNPIVMFLVMALRYPCDPSYPQGFLVSNRKHLGQRHVTAVPSRRRLLCVVSLPRDARPSRRQVERPGHRRPTRSTDAFRRAPRAAGRDQPQSPHGDSASVGDSRDADPYRLSGGPAARRIPTDGTRGGRRRAAGRIAPVGRGQPRPLPTSVAGADKGTHPEGWVPCHSLVIHELSRVPTILRRH